MITTSAEAAEIHATMTGLASQDPDLIESLHIIAETAEALRADELSESEWEAAQEYAGNRCQQRD